MACGCVRTLEVLTSPTIECEDPTARLASPFDVYGGGPDWQAQVARANLDDSRSTGLTVGDLTGDGLTDVLIVPRLFAGQSDGTLLEEPSLLPQLGDAHGSSAADFDGDGDLDLAVVGTNEMHLLRNDDGRFTDVTSTAGLADIGKSNAVSWADIDRDGDLDLFVPIDLADESLLDPDGHPDLIDAILAGDLPPAQPNRLFLNHGDGTFTDVSERLPPTALHGYTQVSGWYDVNGDGDIDLILVNDFGAQNIPNRLLQNRGRGQSFQDVSAGSGLDVQAYGMGLGVGDINGDLVADFLSTDWERMNLSESFEDGQWFSSELARGLTAAPPRHASWAASLADLDNDGDLDALVAFGRVSGHSLAEEESLLEGVGLHNPAGQPDALYLQDESGTFEEVAAEWGLDGPTDGWTHVTADLNQDGWLDIVREDGIFLSRCGEGAWLRVRLWGTENNPNGIGARIEVDVSDRTHVRWIESGSVGYLSSGPPEAHFGLGTDPGAVTVRVTWPDGLTTTSTGVEANRVTMFVRTDASLEPPELLLGVLR